MPLSPQATRSAITAQFEDCDALPTEPVVARQRICPVIPSIAKTESFPLTKYAAVLGSITQGLGSYTMNFSHYDVVPGNVQQQIVAKAKIEADEDE